MSDIVERLRYADQAIDRGNYAEAKAAAWQGHLELTALRAENEKLRAALTFYAAWPQSPSTNMAALIVDAGRKARAALEEKQ